MPLTIFFSWQADTSTTVGRNLIERALEQAVGRISRDITLDEPNREITIDRDTKGVAGTPPIVDTIFKKIDNAAAFLPDLTFVGKRLDGRPTPNPNVLIEYGWALKALSYSCMVPVMNTAFGEPTPESMPFDMRHLRNPISFHCLPDADEDTRRTARENLSKQLESAIRAILENRSSQDVQPAKAEPFAYQKPLKGQGRFRTEGEALGLSANYFKQDHKIYLSENPAIWLRVMPKFDQGKTFSITELKKAIQGSVSVLQPLNQSWGTLSFLVGHDGYGVYPPNGEVSDPVDGVLYLFKTGEIWSTDTYWSTMKDENNNKFILLNEKNFRNSLKTYSETLNKLGINPPYKWIAGIEGVYNRGILMMSRSGYYSSDSRVRGSFMLQSIVEEGIYIPPQNPADALKPFFDRVYECCGLERPAWLNTDTDE
jgi:hypothetical protein